MLAGCATVDLSTPAAVSIEDRVHRSAPVVTVTRTANGALPHSGNMPASTPTALPLPKPTAESAVIIEEVLPGAATVRHIEPIAR